MKILRTTWIKVLYNNLGLENVQKDLQLLKSDFEALINFENDNVLFLEKVNFYVQKNDEDIGLGFIIHDEIHKDLFLLLALILSSLLTTWTAT